MVSETNKASILEFMDRAFNRGDLSVIDEQTNTASVDHQELPGTEFAPHIKAVVMGLRTAFPDLHFEIGDMITEGDIVAFRSTMTGTHLGAFRMGPRQGLPPTGRKISVAHLHFIRMVDGKMSDLWHQWDIPGLMRQLGVVPEPQRQ